MSANFRTTLILATTVSLLGSWPNSTAAANNDTSTSAAPQAPTVTVTTTETTEIASTVLVTGTLIPRETVVVGSDVDGLRIVELLVDAGDTVRRGELLARLETDMLETEIAQNAAQISGSEASLAQAQTQVTDAESVASEAQSSLARARALASQGYRRSGHFGPTQLGSGFCDGPSFQRASRYCGCTGRSIAAAGATPAARIAAVEG